MVLIVTNERLHFTWVTVFDALVGAGVRHYFQPPYLEGFADHLDGKVTAVIHVARWLFKEVAVFFTLFTRLGHPNALFFVELFAPNTQIDSRKVGPLEEGVAAVLGAEGTLLLQTLRL